MEEIDSIKTQGKIWSIIKITKACSKTLSLQKMIISDELNYNFKKYGNMDN